jgi:hypothetical protein
LAGTSFRISKVPDFTPLRSTILGREVEHIEAVVTWLNKQGVTMEKYPFVQDRERGIWTTPNADKVAWFKDLDGTSSSQVNIGKAFLAKVPSNHSRGPTLLSEILSAKH